MNFKTIKKKFRNDDTVHVANVSATAVTLQIITLKGFLGKGAVSRY